MLWSAWLGLVIYGLGFYVHYKRVATAILAFDVLLVADFVGAIWFMVEIIAQAPGQEAVAIISVSFGLAIGMYVSRCKRSQRKSTNMLSYRFPSATVAELHVVLCPPETCQPNQCSLIARCRFPHHAFLVCWQQIVPYNEFPIFFIMLESRVIRLFVHFRQHFLRNAILIIHNKASVNTILDTCPDTTFQQYYRLFYHWRMLSLQFVFDLQVFFPSRYALPLHLKSSSCRIFLTHS